MSDDKYRTTLVKRGDHWEEIDFEDLKEGDRFMLKEPDGCIVKDKSGNESFVATSQPFKRADGVWAVKTYGGEN